MDVDGLNVGPSLPELKLAPGAFAKWPGMMDGVDETTIKTVDYIRNHPLIPKSVTVSGWIWEVENQRLRKLSGAHQDRSLTSSASKSFGVGKPQPPRWR